MYVVITDFIFSDRLVDLPVEYTLSATRVAALRTAIQTLHNKGWVFGDLREPNIFLTDGAVQLVDCDWCGKVGGSNFNCGPARYDVPLYYTPSHLGSIFAALVEQDFFSPCDVPAASSPGNDCPARAMRRT
ncbi:hypothetical protein NEOLEDRAFT_1242864 [Neolentinus lepideus HHB14362 ss-1]|uniref:Protein kinase domain-containing protein n=1 Tax=Neolentinus lepideus HHB14362 ss-1 TaxID=1314782 RepID=A0A165RJW1_9AGAM|nr:hypothetical protein NEOLEDRAFT_1242864 [Neolentinus lepideus HHB14362 ss-1]